MAEKIKMAPPLNPTAPPPPPSPTAPSPRLHQSNADEDDETVKQLQECSSVYLSLQDCLVKTDRNWKPCQKATEAGMTRTNEILQCWGMAWHCGHEYIGHEYIDETL